MSYQETLSELDSLEAELHSKRLSFIETYDIPQDVFDLFLGDLDAVCGWLFSTQSALSGSRPVDLLDNEKDRQRVITLVHQLGHGVTP